MGSSRNTVPNWLNWFIAAASLLVLVVNVYNALAVSSIRATRLENQGYQKAYAQGVKVMQINNQLIKVLANVSARTGDGAIKAVLASEGVTFSVDTQPDPDEIVD